MDAIQQEYSASGSREKCKHHQPATRTLQKSPQNC